MTLLGRWVKEAVTEVRDLYLHHRSMTQELAVVSVADITGVPQDNRDVHGDVPVVCYRCDDDALFRQNL